MLKPAHIISLALAIFSIFLYFSAYFHHQTFIPNESPYARSISTLIANITRSPENTSPNLTSKALVVTEEKAILYVLIISCSLASISLLIALRDLYKNGKDKHSLLMVFLPLGIISSITMTLLKTGLLNNL